MSENSSSTHSALLLGAALIAFGPTVSLFFRVVYSEAKLVIIVTISAFCFLCSALFSSLAYLAIPLFYDNALWMIVPSVFFQALSRVQFVKYYLKVEAAISQTMMQSTNNDTCNNSNLDHDNTSNHPALALNDVSSALAGGIGYGLMHGVLLCGTLLASEGGDDVGTLYQDSCPDVPSVLNTAAMAMLFSVLDIILMFFYFYAVRRKLQSNANFTSANGAIHANNFNSNTGIYNIAKQPNTVIGVAMGAHLSAGLSSLFNGVKDGCYVALPATLGVVFLTGLYFTRFIMPNYLPMSQKEQIYRGTHQS